MKRITACMALLALVASCREPIFLKNQTRPGGYAMGEKIQLRFATNETGDSPDSIAVFVLEKKTDYRYTVWARRVNCEEVCEYAAIWDGRKEDGNWPVGGRYLIYGSMNSNSIAYSDTIQIGLGD